MHRVEKGMWWMGRRARLGSLMLGAATVVGMVVPAQDPGEEGTIAFYSDRDGNPEIYVMKADGSGQTRVTSDPAFDVGPALSPDGSWIAFLTGRHDPEGVPPEFNWEIYLVRADGSGERRLTNNARAEDHLAWSPDGTRISFNADYDGDGYQEIYVLEVDSSGLVRLTFNAANDQWASWSPDGAHLVFSSDREGGLDLYVMAADGSDQTRISRDPRPEIFPEWSPNGDLIAYMVLDGGPTLWTVRHDGTEPRRLSARRGEDPAWSPDGRFLAFQDWNAGRMEIYRMSLAGDDVRNLSRHPSNDFWASWR